MSSSSAGEEVRVSGMVAPLASTAPPVYAGRELDVAVADQRVRDQDTRRRSAGSLYFDP